MKTKLKSKCCGAIVGTNEFDKFVCIKCENPCECLSIPQSETPRYQIVDAELILRFGVAGDKYVKLEDTEALERELGEANYKINAQANSLCNIADSCRVRGEVSMSKPLDERVIACFHKYEQELSQVRGELAEALEHQEIPFHTCSGKECKNKSCLLRQEHDLLAKQNHKMREYLTHRLTKFDNRSLTTEEHGEQNWIISALSSEANDTTSIFAVLTRAEVEGLPCTCLEYPGHPDSYCPRCQLLERFAK